MSSKSMVLLLEGIRSFNGRVKAWMWTSPVFPAAMPILISKGMVPCKVSSKDVAMISKAGPWGCSRRKSGSERAIFMRVTAVNNQAWMWSAMMVGPSLCVAKRCWASARVRSSHWCHQNFMIDSSAVAVSEALGMI